MSNKISFRNLSVTSTRIEVEAVLANSNFPLWFQFDRGMDVSTSQIAAALSTLCGTKFDEIDFDFGVADSILQDIALFTRAKVTSSETCDYIPKTSEEITISFSGGFDSLAAFRLLGESVNLVSLDFGGWFEREAKFFQRFDPIVISTNVRRTPSQKDSFARNHWTFMSIGAILSALHLGTGYHAFGTILGESFSRRPTMRKVPPLSMLGIQNIPATDGITEIGTANVLVQTDPGLISDSIESLAGATDRKRFLKTILATVVADERGIALDLPPIPKSWKNKIKFNSSYTTAMTALYLIAKGRSDLISPLYESIPESAFDIVDGLKMDFMAKVCTDHYQGIPQSVAPRLANNFIRLGFLPYSESDWVEARLIRAYLNRQFGY